MSRPLPNIPVKHLAIRKVLTVTEPFDAKLRAYIAYYAEQQGVDPKRAPSESDTIIALVDSYLARDQGFTRYLRDKTASGSASKKTAPIDPNK